MTLHKYYSGFSLKGEESLFDEYAIVNDFTVRGFSFGAQKAFEAVLASKQRVDKLQLFSPAFFQNQDKKYKRLQLMFFKKDAKSYCENFLNNVCHGSTKPINSNFLQGSYEELDELLHYEWNTDKLKQLQQRGVQIEVYLGSKDKIIDANAAKEFFKEVATVYYIKEKGHIL